MNLPRVWDESIDSEGRWLVIAVFRDGNTVTAREVLIPEGEDVAGYNKTWTAKTTSDRERKFVRAAP